ncbi:hypothetical protein [Prevotella pallens]
MIEIVSYSKKKNTTSNTTGTGNSSGGGTMTNKNGVGKLEQHLLWGQPFDGTEDVKGDMVGVGNISADNVSAKGVEVKKIKADSGKVENIEGESSYYKEVKAENLTSTTGTIDNITSTTANTDTITSKVANTEKINAANGTINNLTAGNASITSLTGDNAVIGNLTVTGAAHFFKLSIDEVQATQGQIIVTPANAKIDKVEVLDNGDFKCSWRNEQEGKKIENCFAEQDFAVCQTMNVAEGVTYNAANKFYWRKVESIGTDGNYHFVVLSKSIKSPLSNSIPEVGDNIVQLGNNNDRTRQNAIIVSSYNTGFLDKTVIAPSIVQYAGINNFDLEKYKINVISASGNKFRGEFSVSNGKTLEEYVAENINKTSAGTPYIGTDGNWYVWNNTTKKYENSGIAAKGEDGKDGKSPVSLVITPSTFVFNTDTNGNIEGLAANEGKIKLFVGDTEVLPDNVKILSSTNCTVAVSGGNKIKFLSITPDKWSGSAEIEVTYKEYKRRAIVDFIVDCQKWNNSRFSVNDRKFESIIEQGKSDKEGIEKRISTIEQTAKDIKLEVERSVSGGANLLKGASLRNLDLLILQKPENVVISNNKDFKVLSIIRNDATQNEWNGCRFPKIRVSGGKTYTISFYAGIYDRDTEIYIEVRYDNSVLFNRPKTKYFDLVPKNDTGERVLYSYTFDIEEGYEWLDVFIGLKRNGKAYISEIQLEEGGVVTGWKDPDIVESIERAGIHINGADMTISAQANRFNFLDQQNNIVASVDNEGAIQGLKFKTRNNGAGYIDLTGSMMSVFGAVSKNIEFGIDTKGQAILKFYDNAGNNTLNLSPDGIKAENITASSFSPLEVCYIGEVGTVILDNPSDAVFDKFFTFNKPYSEDVYLYTGAKISGNYIADTGWSKQQVEENSGRYFKRARASNDNTVINGVYAAASPMFEGIFGGGTGYTTELYKKIQTITVYVFRNGNIQTIPMHRIITL